MVEQDQYVLNNHYISQDNFTERPINCDPICISSWDRGETSQSHIFTDMLFTIVTGVVL